jgi:hypothetical protein
MNINVPFNRDGAKGCASGPLLLGSASKNIFRIPFRCNDEVVAAKLGQILLAAEQASAFGLCTLPFVFRLYGRFC